MTKALAALAALVDFIVAMISFIQGDIIKGIFWVLVALFVITFEASMNK